MVSVSGIEGAFVDVISAIDKSATEISVPGRIGKKGVLIGSMLTGAGKVKVAK
jgi:hypothetical protein